MTRPARDLRSYLVTTADAAALTGLTEATIRQWAHRGHLTRHGSPRNALWDWRELDQVRHAPRAMKRRVG